MRLFAAVVPPPRVAEHLAAALDRYRSGDTSLRWTRVESWHLTLAFYGSCTEAQAEERGAWLRERLRGHGPVRLRLSGAGRFRGVLWAGVDGDADALHAIARAAGAEDERVVKEARRWHPHLTLARWRASRPPRVVSRVVDGLADYRGPEWVAEEVVLLNSELHPAGARYTAQARCPLTSSRPPID